MDKPFWFWTGTYCKWCAMKLYRSDQGHKSCDCKE